MAYMAIYINKYKSREKIPLTCEQCGQKFMKEKHDIQRRFKNNSNPLFFCSRKCAINYSIDVPQFEEMAPNCAEMAPESHQIPRV